METKEFDFKGKAFNGFAMLLVDILVLAASIAAFVMAIDKESALFGIAFLLLFIVFIFFSCGFVMQEPNEARALLFFGKYVGTFRKTGFYFINPVLSNKKVSFRARNLNAEPIKVNDKTGNPILIGLVLVWKLKDTYKALFEIDSEIGAGQVGSMANARMNRFEKFVSVQSDAALRQVAGMYAYDENGTESEEITLRNGSEIINEVLKDKLNERLTMAGLEVTEARINYLAYAPEIAAVMLRRQQATAIISAREKIVDGAVSMVKMALDKLSAEDIVELDEEKKAAMVSNLLVVLCADEPAQPVINSGTLNH